MELLRLFQICGAEYAKLLPPKEIELILGFASKFLFPERRFLGGVYMFISSLRYAGAYPFKHLKT